MKPLKTVEKVELEKYIGKWYEIARLPNRFEKGLVCVTAEYSIRQDGRIKVINSGHPENEIEKIKTATGKAWRPDENEPGRLKVQFFWPFSGGYYIFYLDKDYRHTLVGDPSRKYLWLLSREPKMDDFLYQELLNIARKNDFDIDKVYKTPQHCF